MVQRTSISLALKAGCGADSIHACFESEKAQLASKAIASGLGIEYLPRQLFCCDTCDKKTQNNQMVV
jgi:hypothetical protein